jgi:hypothetical protein
MLQNLSVIQKFFINMLIGGFFIALAGFTTEIFSSTLGGVLYGSLPIGAFYLYIFVYLNNIHKTNVRIESLNFINGSVLGGIIWVILVCLLYINPDKPFETVSFSMLSYLILISLVVGIANKNNKL